MTNREYGFVGMVVGLALALLVQGLPASAAFFTSGFSNSNISIPLSAPIVSLPAATSTGSVASSTIYFEVTAVDGLGNQTNPSASLATTTLSNAGFELTWPALAGATGYDVYFSTTTKSANQFLQYFPATTSGAFDFTSTSSPTYASAPSANLAYVVKFPQASSSIIYGGNGTATTTQTASTTALQVNGNFVAEAPATTTACYSKTAGQMFYNTSSNIFYGCDGTNWKAIFN